MAPRHRRPPSAGHRIAVVVAATGTVAIIAAASIVAVGKFDGGQAAQDLAAAATGPASPAPSPPTPSASPTPPTSPPAIAAPLHLVSTVPASAATAISGHDEIVLTFDSAVASTTPLPTISPAIPGSWSRPTASTLAFQPDVGFAPDTKVTVVVPADLQAADGGQLAAASTLRYTVADGSLLRLQELLAELGYLPVVFTPTNPETNTASGQNEMAYDPPAGAFTMRYAGTPPALAALWKPAVVTPMTTGAIMSFENTHGLKVDGAAGAGVWTALLADAVIGRADPQSYSWALTTMTRPETLQIWSDGAFVYSTKANTGIRAAPTPIGSWPVFGRYRSQTMRGTNPDGSKYNDPGVPYVNYFHAGDAIHGFRRASYGSQQSLGCVELPYYAASQVWNLIDYGTVVTVTR
jgi:peptidoglycan hydrolase-like protein with peptidoglycan-binding domain